MATSAGTLELLARELATALLPLEQRLQPGQRETFLAGLGLRLPSGLDAAGDAIAGVVEQVGGLPPALVRLTDAIEAGEPELIAQVGVDLLGRIREVLDAIDALRPALTAAINVTSGLTQAQQARLQALAELLPRRLLDAMLISYLQTRSAGITDLLRLIGVVDENAEPIDPADPTVLPVTRRTLHLDRLLRALTDPAGWLRDTFDFGNPTFDGMQLWTRVAAFLDSVELPFLLLTPPAAPPVLEAFLIRFGVDPTATPPAMTARLRVPATFDVDQPILSGPLWTVAAIVRARYEDGLEARLEAPLTTQLRAITGQMQLEASVEAVAERGGAPILLLGQAGGSRLEFVRFTAALGVRASSSAGQGVTAEPAAQLALGGVRVVIDLSSGDGFLSTVTGGRRFESSVDLRAGWTPSGGLRLDGGAGLELALPRHVELGPVDLDTLYIAARPAADGSWPIEVSAAVTAVLGPITASVDRAGFLATARFVDGGGNLGRVDLSLGFKPPNGVGLDIDAEVVSGGGFLSFDPARQEYAGALELQLGKIGVKAIGLLSTGPDDWSLVLLLYAQIPPVQLGFGFTLDAVGGLIGLQRGVDIGQLAAGMRTGAFDDLLFPPDPVGDAARILGRLRTLFPVHPRSLVVGPMVDVHWGSPLILTARLAVLLQIDNVFGSGGAAPALARVVVVGQLHVDVGPTEQDPYARVVRLIVDVLGFWDLADKRYGFLAALRDSTVGGVDITGGLGVWGEYGAQSRFLLAAGGFNPRFRDIPAQLSGVLDRLGASFSVGRLHLSLAGYFALTPATIQAGFDLHVTASIGPVGIVGDLGLDVLIYRRPRTHFIADFRVVVAITYHGHSLAGVKLTGTIEGPGQWHVAGKLTFSILWWDISTTFDESWGSLAPVLTDLVDVAALLGAALAARENWTAQLPAGGDALVTLAPRRGDQAPRAHPLGRFAFSQQVAPLGLTLEKFGDSGVSGPDRFEVESVTIGRRPITETTPGASSSPVRDHFARAQFLEVPEEDRLTRPSFEELDSGVQFSSAAFETGPAVRVGMSYETAYLDLDSRQTRPEPRPDVGEQALGYRIVEDFGRCGAAGRAPQRATDRMGTVRMPLTVSAPQLAAADRLTLDGLPLAGSPTSAQMLLEQRIRRAGLTAAQVVETYQLAQV
jgi:Family of unknown function (DUF6603)